MAVRPSISHYARALRAPLTPLPHGEVPVETFSTERLSMKPLAMADLYDLHECMIDERYAALARGTLRTFNRFEEVQKFLENTLEVAHAGFCFPWSVRSTADGRFVGFLNLCCPAGVTDRRRLNLEFGLDARWWGHGYGSEALAGLIRHVFTAPGSVVNKIEGYCTVENTPSSRAMQRAGMRLVARLEEHHWHDQRFHDALVHAVLRREVAPPTATV
jgi:ribosomal-protein-alanine N-acetyltransferase